MELKPEELPKAANAQVAVLGSMLIDERCIPVLMRSLDSECFPDASLRHVFDAVARVWSAKKPVDPVTVLEELGGDAYGSLISRIMELTPTAANCEAYASALVDAKELAAIRSACFAIATGAADLDDAKLQLSEAAKLLVRGRKNIRRYSYIELFRLFLARQDDKTPPDWLDTGIKALDERVHIGLGDFVLIGAYSSVGKTAFALQLARSVSQHGKRVAFYSYETNEERAGDRLFANAANVSLQAIKKKQLTDGDWRRVTGELARADQFNFDLIESARFTVKDIRADILAYGYKVVFLDYVQIVPGLSQDRERKDVVAENSIALHLMCQELGVTIIALSQVTLPELNKSGGRRWICMQDLRESKQLLQDAETVILLDYEEPKNRESDRVLIVDKNKDGEIGHIFLKFVGDKMRFYYREDVASPASSKQNKEPDYKNHTFFDLDDEEEGEIPF